MRSMDNWYAAEILAHEQLREARAEAARSRYLATVEPRRRPGAMGSWLAAALISLGERLGTTSGAASLMSVSIRFVRAVAD
jgi:hypothetical protein